MSQPELRSIDTIQVNLVLEEIEALLSALSKETNIHPSLQRLFIPLTIKLEQAERKIYEQRREAAR